MTRKQYYLRLSKLVRANLVKRVEGKYEKTIFGKVIHEALLRLAVGVSNRSKLMAFDLLYSTSTDTCQRKIKFYELDN